MFKKREETIEEKFEKVIGFWLDDIYEEKIEPGEPTCKQTLEDLQHLVAIHNEYKAPIAKTKQDSVNNAIEAVKTTMHGVGDILVPTAQVVATIAVPIITAVAGGKVLKLIQNLEEDAIFTPLDSKLIMRILGCK